MKLTDLGKSEAKRAMGIDANTHSMAWCIFYNRRPEIWGKINFSGKDFYTRLHDASNKVAAVSRDFHVDYIALEGAILAKTQNPDVTIKLSMMYGAILSELMRTHTKVVTVKPLEWQSWIGNPNLTPKERAVIKSDFPDKPASFYREKSREIRKQRTIDIFNKKWPHLSLDDDDVADSVGLAYYTYNHLTRR